MSTSSGVPKGTRKTKRGSRLRVVLVSIAVALVALGLGWVVLFSPVFALKTVAIEGTTLLPVEEVETAAAAPIGLPLARVSERQVAERVAALPAVAEVKVTRTWPSTLRIAVTERRPVLRVGDGDNVMVVDREGAVFRAHPPAGLLEGRGPIEDSRLLAGVAALVESLPPELHNRSVLVEFRSANAIMLRLDDDREIFFGSADQAEIKGQVALALVRGTNAQHIDVSAPSRPSTR